MCLAFVPFDDRPRRSAFVHAAARRGRETWRTRDPHGLDVSAIEHMDAVVSRCCARTAPTARSASHSPTGTAIALLVTLELPPGTTTADAFDEIGRAREPARPDTPLVRFCRRLDEAGVLDDVEIAVPGDRAARAQLLALREAVPAGVNARVGRAKQHVDRADREDRGGHDRPVRVASRADDDLRRGIRASRPRRRRLGTHLRRQPAPERHPAIDRRRRVGARKRSWRSGAR